ncbi:hypothetical protein LSUE1_G004478 [Lachnellula suecica]|uniref:Metallo-beta-lactamase domain-containing protein n=1 Tax=Lachnellula suecica TaxID=602035 RepID=A0A8T9C6B2_9HELO|nr:hypothetical protein LSUE1_G004478 [Lachnellula suecica]
MALQHLVLDPSVNEAPTRDHEHHATSLPIAKSTQTHPTKSGSENASIFFVGTATTILEWEGIRLMTDPNFLHAGDHVHLGPGVTGTRQTNPAIDLHELPRIDVVLLSHYHAYASFHFPFESPSFSNFGTTVLFHRQWGIVAPQDQDMAWHDHFDEKVEASLRRSLPIITTPHAKSHLANKPGTGEAFTSVYELDAFQSMMVDIHQGSKDGSKVPAIKVTGMPGKHVPPGILSTLNDLAKAVPPTNGWMLELGYQSSEGSDADFSSGYRIYISGDTLMVDELKEIPERYQGQNIDLMLVHLGGTSIPAPNLPLLMVTMDAAQGLQLVQLINPDMTIPIHYDDYDVFLSPLSDFKKAMDHAGLSDKVVYLDRKDQYKFEVKVG